ncbi:MAG: hypothetical protein KAH18_09095 [Psychromonas sp.]|nr:hypothetical protein [Psychromonas sp.]
MIEGNGSSLAEFALLRHRGINNSIFLGILFNTLMGDNVAPRRQFIEKNELRVENLDI